MSDLDDLLRGQVEAPPSIGSRPLLLQVVAALVVAGVLVALLVSVILAGVSSVAPESPPPGKHCTGLPGCYQPAEGG